VARVSPVGRVPLASEKERGELPVEVEPKDWLKACPTIAVLTVGLVTPIVAVALLTVCEATAVQPLAEVTVTE
jgi:hypothetical protein